MMRGTYPCSAIAPSSGDTGILAFENFSAGIEALRLNSGCDGEAEDEVEDTFRCLLTFFFFPMLQNGKRQCFFASRVF